MFDILHSLGESATQQISSTMPYVKASVARKHYGCSSSTLHVWRTNGKIQCCRVGEEGQWRFDIPTVAPTAAVVNKDDRIGIIYARVSNTKQSEQLDAQIAHLQSKYPQHEVYQDVASGLNYKRPAFNKILDLCMEGKVREVCVTHKDRLCRFSYDLVKSLLKRTDTKISVHTYEAGESIAAELADDIMSVVAVFGTKVHANAKRATKKAKTAHTQQAMEVID